MSRKQLRVAGAGRLILTYVSAHACQLQARTMRTRRYALSNSESDWSHAHLSRLFAQYPRCLLRDTRRRPPWPLEGSTHLLTPLGSCQGENAASFGIDEGSRTTV